METAAQTAPEKHLVTLQAECVAQQDGVQISRQQLGDAVSEVWNCFELHYGAFADEYVML